jgi:uncharacterized membrane protein
MPSRKRIAVAAIVLAVIVGGGMALRIYGIGRSGFWLDEAYSELRARGTLGDTIREAVAGEGSPPLYLLTLRVWRGIAGTSEARFRLLSAIFDGLTILALYAFAREMLNRRASLIAAGMYAVSSFAVYYAQEARQYALLTLTVVLSSWFFHRIAVSHRTRHAYHYILYVISTAAALYAFPYAIFVVAAQGLFLAVMILAALSRQRRGDALLRPVAALACLLAAVAAFSPYLPVLLGRAEQLREMQGIYAGGFAARVHAAEQLPAVARSMIYGTYIAYMGNGTLAAVFVLLFIALPAALGIANLRGPRGARLFVALTLLLPLIGVVLLPFRVQIPEAKHIGFLLPFFIVAACALFSRHFVGRRRLLANLLPVAEGCLVVALFAGSQAFDLRDYYTERTGKEAWREVVPLLAEQLHPGDAVICSPYYARIPFEYYLGGKATIKDSTDPFTGLVGRRWRMKNGEFSVPVLIPQPERMNTGEGITSEDVAQFLDENRNRPERVWLVVNRSNVAAEEPGVYAMLEDSLTFRYNEIYPEGFKEEYPGTVGTIRLRLFVRR